MTVQGRENARTHSLVVTAHPAASSLTRSVTAVVVEGLQALGHTTQIADLAGEGFDPVSAPQTMRRAKPHLMTCLENSGGLTGPIT